MRIIPQTPKLFKYYAKKLSKFYDFLALCLKRSHMCFFFYALLFAYDVKIDTNRI